MPEHHPKPSNAPEGNVARSSKPKASPLRQKLAQRGPRPPNPLTRELKGHDWFVACAKLGGKARWVGTTHEQRSEAGRRAAIARWHPGRPSNED